MRADRLLSLLLILQAHRQISAPALADRLEVSVRTVYRDVEALSMAGIPIYANTGRSGGITLDEAYRMTLAGLSAEDLHALVLTDTSTPLQQLGLGSSGQQTVLKLLGMLSSAQQRETAFVRQRLFIDPTGWYGDDAAPHLAQIQQAVWDDQRVTFTYMRWDGEQSRLRVDPYALVFKTGNWYLIGQKTPDKRRIYRVSRMIDVALLDETFERNHDFDVQAYWQETSGQFLQNVAVYEVTLQCDRKTYAVIEMLFQHRYHVIEEQADEFRLRLRFSDFYEARMAMLGLGAGAYVIEPAALREAVATCAEGILQRYRIQAE
jgi:predicted DNA-binding transcriptional regulator YafY